MSIQEDIEWKEGQLVRVRNRRWLIEEVEEFPVPQHARFNHSPRGKLACVDDDSAGELLGRLEVDVRFFESMSVESNNDGGEG